MKMPIDYECTFAVLLEPEEEGGFIVRVPSIPEIVACGKDEREALAMAEDAIRLVGRDPPAQHCPNERGSMDAALVGARHASPLQP